MQLPVGCASQPFAGLDDCRVDGSLTLRHHPTRSEDDLGAAGFPPEHPCAYIAMLEDAVGPRGCRHACGSHGATLLARAAAAAGWLSSHPADGLPGVGGGS